MNIIALHIIVSIEEVDPSQPPCEVKPLKASEPEVIFKSTVCLLYTSDAADE